MIPQFIINSDTLAAWFNLVRITPEHSRNRMLECFWDTQLAAKVWLTNELQKIVISQYNNIYIFGGWYGILASMLSESTIDIENIYSIDIDPQCEIGKKMFGDAIQLVTCDMKDYIYPWESPPTIVINTSAEHVEQCVYDAWYDAIPSNTIIVVQSNNFYECVEHRRCSKNLREFMHMNHVVAPLYSGELANAQYTRFMAIWRK